MPNTTMTNKDEFNDPSDQAHVVTIKWQTWKELLKIAGRQIDPETADVTWWWGQVVDPYGVHPEVVDECDCVGRLHFARALGSDVWIEFGDLPEKTRKALWNKSIKSETPIDETIHFDVAPSTNANDN
jgi:hypothetical protein